SVQSTEPLCPPWLRSTYRATGRRKRRVAPASANKSAGRRAVPFGRRNVFASVLPCFSVCFGHCARRNCRCRMNRLSNCRRAAPVAENKTVEVRNPDATLWSAQVRFVATSNPQRWSPAIHVNQAGYSPGLPKKAMVGYYLGSLGELEFGGTLADAVFKLIA